MMNLGLEHISCVNPDDDGDDDEEDDDEEDDDDDDDDKFRTHIIFSWFFQMQELCVYSRWFSGC